jgi:hypothetical protein
MNELVPAKRVADWRRLKALVLDSVSSPITRRVYNLGLDEFFEWFGREPPKWLGFEAQWKRIGVPVARSRNFAVRRRLPQSDFGFLWVHFDGSDVMRPSGWRQLSAHAQFPGSVDDLKYSAGRCCRDLAAAFGYIIWACDCLTRRRHICLRIP